MDVHNKEQRSRNMQAIRSKNTKIEILLGRALWAKGLRYRKDNRKIFGKPDFTFRKCKIAIFCDGEFFHGKDWEKLQKQIGNNRDFWIKKIQQNINRDKLVNEELINRGWIVLRFWGNDIKNNLENCVLEIESAVYTKN